MAAAQAAVAVDRPKRRADVSSSSQPPPSKRRRLNEAAVLCMREVFRAAVTDGDLTEDERMAIQSVAVLLSEVTHSNGQTWVNFPSTGELQDLTPQQLRRVQPFLEKVAESLLAHEAKLCNADNAGSVDCLKLVAVPWASGLTARELLACCTPDEELLYTGHFGWLEKVTNILPTQFMLRSRVRELINYYYIDRYTPTAVVKSEGDTPSFPKRFIVFALPLVSPVLSSLRGVAVSMFACGKRIAYPLAKCVVYVMTSFVALVARAAAWNVGSESPIMPALRLFAVAFLQTHVKKLLNLIVMITRWRVLLCLASCSVVLGKVLFPFVVIAKMVLGWHEGRWIDGCACDRDYDTPSLLSFIPVRAADGVVQLLSLPGFVDFPETIDAWFLDSYLFAVESAHPVLSFLLDLAFSYGLAEGLALMVRRADERSQLKLVWMSMSLGRLLRERQPIAGRSADPGATPAAPPYSRHTAPRDRVAATRSEAMTGPEVGGLNIDVGESALPAWNEGGDWTLFES